MPWQIDHIFICTAAEAPEAAELTAAGLVEGEPNTHPGQGTANRRFFFDNGFLELLYVTDASEARSEPTAPTRIWERWAGRTSHTNPFGICFSSEDGKRDALPFKTWSHTPDYLPEGRAIWFAEDQPLSEPELFALGWPHRPMTAGQPTDHPAGLHSIRAVTVGLPDPQRTSVSLRAARAAGLLNLARSATPRLTIEFTAERPVQITLPSLGVTLSGRVCATGQGKHPST